MAEPRKEREPFHVTVAQKLIDRLEKGTAPWQRPWEPGVPSSHLPHNPVTGKRYNGINILQLMSEEREDARWMTYKQAEAQGWQVRKGEKGTPVQYWKFAEEVDKTDDNGNVIRNSKGEIEKETVLLERPRVFWATVFNAEQIDGIPERTLKVPEWDPVERAEAIIQASGVKVSHDQSDRAFYRVSTDRVHMPGRDQFPSADRYYATKLHEMGHWTGHPSRLDRPVGQNPFGSEEYAKEELRAEIASMIIGDELGIGHDPEQHAAYVKSWIKVLKDDPMEIFRAAADAEKIQKYILGFQQQQVQGQQAGAELTQQQNTQGQKQQDLSYPVPEAWRYAACEVFDEEMGKRLGVQNYSRARELSSMLRDYEEMSFEPSAKEQALLEKNKDDIAEAKRWINENVLMNPLVKERVYETVRDFSQDTGDEQEDKLTRAYLDEMASKLAGRLDATPEGRYELMLASGRRLVDRLVESKLMHPADATLTDARRDLFSMSAAPEADRETFKQASEKAFGVAIPPEWGGEVRLEARRDGKPWNASGFEGEPNQFAVSVVIGDQAKEIGVMRYPEVAITLAERLHHVAAYSEHGASKLQELPGIREKLDARRVESRLQLYSSMALKGNDPRESWINLRDSAVELGLQPRIELGGDGRNDPAFRIRYIDQTGAFTPITTNLNPDGKAVTLIDGKRPGNKAPTEDLQWQREALEEALHLVKANQQQQEAKMDPKEPAPDKTYISVPFKEKNEAKALGARWDSKATSWYVPQGEDLSLFTKWRQAPQPDKGSELEAGQDVPRDPAPVQASAEKKFLAVPYGEREQASALGARWDKGAKSWYIGQGDDPEKFKRWDPAFIAQQPKISVEEEFKEACKAAGLKLDGDPIMDGKRYRVALVDDKGGDKNGVYIGHLDGHPAGYIKNFRTGIAMNWKSKGYDATDEEKAKLNAEAAVKLQQRETERAEKHEEIAARVQGEIQRLVEPTERTPYQQDKGISINKGVLTDRGGKRTYIPAQDINGKTWTMQYIQEDGTKRFPKGGKKEGCFHVVGGMDALAKAPILAVGEGYATMTTASESLGFATVVAFDSGNLKQVAESLQKKFPGKPLLFVADDDVLSAEKSPLGINAGRMKAEAAAKELGGMAVFPVFAPGEARKGLSDFNDLATRSELGREAADRQLKAAMSLSINNARDLARQQAKNRQHEQSVGMSR
jgi:putative DNA primase/helicase